MNKDSAIDYLIVAHTALQSHDKVKSERLVRKAQSLCPDLNPRKEDLLGSQCHLFARFEDLDAVIVFVQQYGAEPTRNTTRTPPTPPEDEEIEKNYTDQDVKDVKDLLAKQKDYYSVLGVEKTCTADEIKKAYRKMAMKFHPDRNQTPHAAEAFKLVSAAYVTLSDAQKRKLYDQYGTDDEHTLHQRRSPFGQRMNVNGQTFTFGQDDDDIFFDLFANLFGGIPQDVMQQRMRMRHQQGMHRQHRQRQHQPQAQTQQGFGFYIVQIGVILFIILSSVLNFSVFSNNPNSSAPAHSNAYYSFQKSNHHPMLREMVVSREIKIPYFVAPNVNHQLNSNMWAKRQVESEVYHNYGPYLQNKCNEEQLVKEKKVQESSSASSGDERWKSMQMAEQMPLPHCDLLHRFKSKVH